MNASASQSPALVAPGERTVIARLLPRTERVVHVGSVDSAWTLAARGALPRLVVDEIDAALPIDRLRAERPLQHIQHLRIESARELGRVLDGAAETLGYARLDCIEFTTHADGAGRDVARALAAGYRLLIVEHDGLHGVPDGRTRQPATYLLVHERLLAPRPVDGAPIIDIGREAARHGVRLSGRGVLHVGAHEGQEAPHYQRLALDPILMIEANPVVFSRLVASLAAIPGARAVERAVSDREGAATLHLASFDQSSSLLPMAGHLDVYPGIRAAGEVSVRTSPLDSIVTELGLRPAQFAVLHIDVQGAELLVLRGAEAVLAAVDLVSVEVSFSELYRGGAQIEDIERWLAARGFRRAALCSPYHPSWGDALYVRAASRPP